MSPSEAAARAFGVYLVSCDRVGRGWVQTPRNAHPKTRYAMKFGVDLKRPRVMVRHELVAYARTKPGGWQAAARWVKRLLAGALE